MTNFAPNKSRPWGLEIADRDTGKVLERLYFKTKRQALARQTALCNQHNNTATFVFLGRCA